MRPAFLRRLYRIPVLLLIVSWAGACNWFRPAPVFYVAPQGSDAHAGTFDHPFATPERARNAIREWKKDYGLPENGFTVYFREGTYTISNTLQLNEADGGNAKAPVIWKAYAGEKVNFTGGKIMANFTSVTDTAVWDRLDTLARKHVVQFNLKGEGIHDFGLLEKSGFGKPVAPVWPEVFFNGEPMTLARYPNQGWVTIAEVPQTGTLKYQGNVSNPGANFDNIPAGRHYGRFRYDDERPDRWSAEEDIWMHGYWAWDWADMYEHVDSIDQQKNEIYLSEPYHQYGYRKGQRYYYRNVLAELDTAGEWYLDRKRGMLYFWPPASIENTDIVLSLLKEPMVALKTLHS